MNSLLAGRQVEIRVPGPPIPWKRTRGSGRRRFIDPKDAAHRARIERAARQVHRGEPLEGPIEAEVVFVFPRPSSLRKSEPGRHRKATRPDVDNLSKSVFDALQPEDMNRVALENVRGLVYAGVIEDDGHVSDLTARKRYAALGEEAHTFIRLREVVAYPVVGPGPVPPATLDLADVRQAVDGMSSSDRLAWVYRQPALRMLILVELARQPGGVKQRELHDVLGYSRRTLRRDLAILERVARVGRLGSGACRRIVLEPLDA